MLLLLLLCELGKYAGVWSFNTCTVSHIIVAAKTKFVELMSSPATACRHAAQSWMKRLSTLPSGYLFCESLPQLLTYWEFEVFFDVN